jgi:hypothetical protein
MRLTDAEMLERYKAVAEAAKQLVDNTNDVVALRELEDAVYSLRKAEVGSFVIAKP